ncbi:MAG: deoxynucleoside kinase [Myxococcales bacterium]|nr:deoxynucleoside kinase [Myxococcales bacterium]
MPRYIVVEGPIGVGKTTLVRRLGELLQARTILEIFEENPFLPDFYRDRERHAFQTEMFFLLSRFRQQETFAQEELFARFTISDYLFVKCRLFASMTLSEHERALFDKVYTILTRNVPVPDLVIHLHAPVPVLMERIQQRGRAYERQVDRGYMEQLTDVYGEYFGGYTATPLLSVDTTHINFHEDAALELLLTEMAATMDSGRRALSGTSSDPIQGTLS